MFKKSNASMKFGLNFKNELKSLKSLIISFVVILLFSINAAAISDSAQLRSQISIEFNTVAGAAFYEVELIRLSNQKKYSFKTKTNLWTALLPVGKYKLHVRGYDSRKVPGEWSSLTDVEVVLPAPILLAPKNNESLKVLEEDQIKIRLQWKAVRSAQSYEVVFNPGDLRWNSKSNNLEVELPVGEAYTWSVHAIDENGKKGNASESFQLSLFGPKLKAPAVVDPKTRYIQNLEWDFNPFATTYSYQIHKKDVSGKWNLVENFDREVRNKIPFSLEFDGGEYRLIVFAQGKMRAKSETTEFVFFVQDGDRSEDGYEKAMLLESLNKDKAWYIIGNYFVTFVDYLSVNSETQKNVNFSAFGGTGRIGVGYSPPENQYGGFGILDLSGYQSPQGILVYPSLELHGLFTKRFEISHLRATWGIFAKELPDTMAGSGSDVTQDKISFLGVHGGVEYWYPLNRLYGVQVNYRLYESLYGMHTSNGEAIQPSMYSQYGILGSYRLRRGLMGLAGYAFRKEEARYKSRLNSLSAAKSGDVNSVRIEGHFLNLLLEYEF